MPPIPGPNEKIIFKWVHISTKACFKPLTVPSVKHEPQKHTSNNINVVNSKMPKDQEVNWKPKLGLFDLHILKRRTIALAEQDDDSYLWHRNKQIHGNNIQEERFK